MPNDGCRVELFGNLRLFVDGRQVQIKSQRMGSLLGLMALELPDQLLRSQVVEILWPERPSESGRNSLSVALHGLRQILEPTMAAQRTILLADTTQIGLNPLAVSTDVQDFQRAIAENRLSDAVAIYRPSLAQGHHLEAFDEAQANLQVIAVKAHEDLVKSLRKASQLREAILVNTQLIAIDPFNERAHVRSIKLNLESGNRASALEAFDALRRMLKSNFGAEPSPAVADLVKGIKRETGNPMVAPEVTTTSNAPRSTLPIRLTKFFGRARELELLHCLFESDAKLITVTGMGGIGKTRLIEEALKEHLTGPNPPAIYFVPLASKKTASEALAEVAQYVAPSSNPSESPLDQIMSVLAAHRSILFLDNLENLLSNDGIEMATLIENLAGSVETVKVVCTSRMAVDIAGETVVRLEALPELTKPDVFDEAKANPRVQLYVNRAKNSNPEFELKESNFKAVAAISDWLEGVPLAIELAAACARSLPPKLLLTRLKARLNLPEPQLRKGEARHRSIRAVLETSYQLLSGNDRIAFCAFSLFRGGLYQDSLDKVLGFDSGPSLDLLARGCLVHAESTAHGVHWRMLEMVREFAEDCFTDVAESPDLNLAYAKTFMFQAEDMRRSLTGHQQREILARMRMDRDNYVRALDFMLDRQGMLEDCVRMLASLWRFWVIAGLLNVGRPRLDKLLSQCESLTVDPALMAQANNLAGNVAYAMGDFHQAKHYHDRAVLHYRQEFQAEGLAAALNNSALADMRLCRFEEAKQSASEAASTAEEHGLADLSATALGTLGLTHYFSGDFESASSALESAAERFRALGNTYAAANNLRHLARARFALSDSSYVALIFESLELAEGLESQALILSILLVMAEMCAKSADTAAASTIFASVQAFRRANGVSFVAGDSTLESEVVQLVVPADPVELAEAIEMAKRSLE